MPDTVIMNNEPSGENSNEISERFSFLSRIHLFNGLTEEQVGAIAEVLTVETYPVGEEIIKQGAEGDRLYLIWAGKVKVSQAGKEKPLATLVDGDYFGEESMLVFHYRQPITVTALEETHLLVLNRENFQTITKQVPLLRTNISVTVNSHRMAQRINFKWLHENEVIYFAARKHPILLVEGLTGPILLLIAAIVGMVAAWYYSFWIPSISALWYVSLLATLGSVAWGVWKFIDWGNDYYIVSDQRVVWVEKVVGIYESRQESPLSAVQRVNVETEFTGRLLDYGNIVIQTIVGSTLTLRNVDHPNQAAALIDQHWKRSKDSSRKMEAEEMNAALRTRLLEGQNKPEEVKGVISKQEEKKDPYENQRSFANLFRLRFENLTTVTYRKHIFVLFEQTWIPVVVLLLLIGFMVYEIFSPTATFGNLFNVSSGLLLFLWVILFFAALLWGIYQYVDWSNDIFQVTPEQIMDIDKTPLGQVTNDIASLDNILSIEYKRVGILELLFNYGTVFITIGGGKEMAFENVYNPSAVQEDIERRRLERITKKEQETIKSERERVADWFAAYFHNEQQFRSEEGMSGERKPEDSQSKNDVK